MNLITKNNIANKDNNYQFTTLLRQLLNRYGIIIIFLVMVVLMSILSPYFLELGNIINVVRQISIIAIAGFGATMVIITAGIDLAIGSVIALAGVIAATFAHPDQYPVIVPVIIGCMVGAFTGLISGSLVAIGKIPAFIATLGMMISARGIALIYSNGHPITNFSSSFDFIARGSLFNIPFMIYVLIITAIISHIILKHTKIGKYIYAIGGNEQAAIVSGVNVTKTLLFVYSYAGLLSGLAGVLLASRISAGHPSAGQGYELDAIAAVVMGGTSLSGGIGTIWGTVLGALIIGVLNNGMDLLHVSAYWQQVFKGLIIVGAILLDKYKTLSVNEDVR
ncbi:ABC transporter permease [Neomoorella thermoacetica]|uniref:ABC transporter permease n=1 Tax=Neomoorella thermoacetica TaxID=1525 RepID=UPI0009164B62|nr:sugar ABC transporter permease [Moorella thermoacetica]OIQ11005.1 ribose transport system permease protein RbsC [Moorella thermoacetica]